MPRRSGDRFRMCAHVMVAGRIFCIFCIHTCTWLLTKQVQLSGHADDKPVWDALAGSRQTSFHRQARTSDAAAASSQQPALPTAAHAARSPWVKHADSSHGRPFCPHHGDMCVARCAQGPKRMAANGRAACFARPAPWPVWALVALLGPATLPPCCRSPHGPWAVETA